MAIIIYIFGFLSGMVLTALILRLFNYQHLRNNFNILDLNNGYLILEKGKK